MIIAAAKMSFERLSIFTLLSLCVNGIVARKLSANIHGFPSHRGAPQEFIGVDLDFRSIGQSATIRKRGAPISRGDLFKPSAADGVIIASETHREMGTRTMLWSMRDNVVRLKTGQLLAPREVAPSSLA